MDLRNPNRANSGPDGTFVDRNTTPGAERPGTVIDAETFNQMLIEFENLIKGAGLTPSSTDLTQLIQINKGFSDAIKSINDNLVKNIINAIYPVGSYYIQFAGVSNTFQTNESPLALYGGSWSLLWSGDSVYFRTEGWLAEQGRINGVQGDAIRNIYGEFIPSETTGVKDTATTTGPFTLSVGNVRPNTMGLFSYPNSRALIFDASRVVPTANENRTTNRLIRVYKRTGLSS